MSCLNGGTFIGRGMCSCPPQWTGNMCQDGKVDSMAVWPYHHQASNQWKGATVASQ